MFGYVKPDNPYLYLKDDTLYKALYCGVCKSISKTCGQRARIGLTYDIAFLSAVIHNLKGEDVTIKKQRCVAHPFRRRPMALRDGITDAMAAVNVVLAYYKAGDDIADGGGGKLKSFLFKKGFKRTLKTYPELSKITERNYNVLRQMEKREESCLDAVCDPFGLMMGELSDYLLGDKATQTTYQFFYYLGKWIYLIDALDDYDKDLDKKNYNPLYYCYGKNSTVKEFLSQNANQISFAFAEIFSRLNQELKQMDFKFNHDLIDNIIQRGLPSVTMAILQKGKDKC